MYMVGVVEVITRIMAVKVVAVVEEAVGPVPMEERYSIHIMVLSLLATCHPIMEIQVRVVLRHKNQGTVVAVFFKAIFRDHCTSIQKVELGRQMDLEITVQMESIMGMVEAVQVGVTH